MNVRHGWLEGIFKLRFNHYVTTNIGFSYTLILLYRGGQPVTKEPNKILGDGSVQACRPHLTVMELTLISRGSSAY